MPLLSSSHSCLCNCNLFAAITLILSLTPSLQIPLLAPISKDDTTQLYTLSLYLKTPLQPTKLHLHLGSSFTWLTCDNSTYTSTSYHHIPCNSSLCSSFHPTACSTCFHSPAPNCATNACSLFPENPITRNTLLATALIDALALPTSDGSTHSPLVLISHFIFSCSEHSLLQGLPVNVSGLASLGRSNHSLPAQISNSLSSPRCFALCLPGSSSKPGSAFFGSTGPYFLSSKTDLSKSLTYTPLIVNPVGDTVITDNAQPSDEYFINLTSIKINGNPLSINASILTVDSNGFGGTKISTAEPYTVLETSIYKAFVERFVNESSAFNLTVTEAVEPFGVCYPAKEFTETRVGPAVPTVDLVMHSEDVLWRMFGGNSMVRIEKEGVEAVWCLGFVDGGIRRRAAVVIGGHQLEDNLVQFDLESNRFGFTSSLLLQDVTCSFQY
ncbi:hypothetical protein RJT34_20148 [Clitoria ternatea]|uniref:Peptidase A1 domain-containing protein n=1 Tax=Clitoria ternatea TaxID=43366 RepID=A0AAN9P5G1_CLITE